MATRLDARTKKAVYGLLALLMLVNLALALFIQSQKGSREGPTSKCFEGTAGCATVQTSHYANTLGVSNPYYGILFFAAWALLFALLAASPHGSWWRVAEGPVKEFLLVSMTIGSLFSLWLLYLQFFVIDAVCVYCLWVDAIMLLSTLVFGMLLYQERAARR